MDRLTSMTAFVKAVEGGSFAAAAVALGVSPQMIAKHVAYLEARLGTRLLNRTTRKQSLTAIGHTYYERCKMALVGIEWADALTEEGRGAPRGRLRINAPVSFGTYGLTPVIARYLDRFANVEVDLVLNDHLIDLVEEGFEAIFRIGALRDTTLAVSELQPFRLVACASPGYLRERRIPSTPTDLSDHECIGYARWPEPASESWRFFRDGHVFDVKIGSRLKVNNAAALLQAALAGFGIVSIAEYVAREAIAAGSLVRVLPNYETPSRPLNVLYHPDRRQTPKLRTFLDTVIQELGAPDNGVSLLSDMPRS